MDVASAAEKSCKVLLCDLLFSGVQAAGGAALAFYTYTNSESRIWPVVYSVAAVGGTYNIFRSIRKIFREPAFSENEEISPYNIATGSIIYCGSLYAFSEAWKLDSELWIPCLAAGAAGLFFASVSIKSISTKKPLFRWCQLLFEYALIASGTIYLLYFRNYEEQWLYGLIFVYSVDTASTVFSCFLREIVDLEEPVFRCIIGMIGSPVLFIYGCAIIRCIHHPTSLLVFLVIVGFSALNLSGAILELQDRVPQPVFERYTHRVCGPMLLFYSSLFAAYVRYHMGWRYTLIMVPFEAGGIYATYQGFKREDQPQ